MFFLWEKIFIRNQNESNEEEVGTSAVKEIMNVCRIKNDSQLYQWMKWYKKGKLHRLQQLIGKGPFEEKLIGTFHAMPNVRNV